MVDGLEWVLTTMQAIARPMYSNPPLHGALIVKEILGDEGLKQQYVSAFPSHYASRHLDIQPLSPDCAFISTLSLHPYSLHHTC